MLTCQIRTLRILVRKFLSTLETQNHHCILTRFSEVFSRNTKSKESGSCGRTLSCLTQETQTASMDAFWLIQWAWAKHCRLSRIHTLMKAVTNGNPHIPASFSSKRVLILCPSTVQSNWCEEFVMWFRNHRSEACRSFRQVYNFDIFKNNPRAREKELKRWHELGGVMVMGYDACLRALIKRDSCWHQGHRTRRDFEFRPSYADQTLFYRSWAMPDHCG